MSPASETSALIEKQRHLEETAEQYYVLLKQGMVTQGYSEDLVRLIGEARHHQQVLQNLIDILSKS